MWRVELKKHHIEFAMKEMSKRKIIDRKSQELVLYERALLSKMYHPFISNLYLSFQDKDTLYLVMDLLTGGDLRYHLFKKKKFNENETKFIICCTLLGLEYLHKNHIIHHDVKPENLIYEDNGFIKIGDFGISKYYRENNKEDISGSIGYIAPEILKEQNHTYTCDYYSLGIVCYELMYGYRPYGSSRRKEIMEEIETVKISLNKDTIPKDWSLECADFVQQLLEIDPKKRLGAQGIEEVKGHPWIKYFNWKDLYLEKLKAPFIPPIDEENFNHKYCNMVEKIGIKTQERYNRIVKSSIYPIVFNSFTYFNRFAKENQNSASFVNPHIIYSMLDEKERMAFDGESGEKVNEKEKSERPKEKSRRAVSMTHTEFTRVITSESNEEEKNKRRSRNKDNNIHTHKKNIFSLVSPRF